MQLSFKRPGKPRRNSAPAPEKLSELREGEVAIIERIELPEAISQRLMEFGFLPGNSVTAARSAPGGDPRVFRVDGAEMRFATGNRFHLFLKR